VEEVIFSTFEELAKTMEKGEEPLLFQGEEEGNPLLFGPSSTRGGGGEGSQGGGKEEEEPTHGGLRSRLDDSRPIGTFGCPTQDAKTLGEALKKR